MDQLQANNLPPFLDPLFDVLADKLPPPIYDALFQLCSYALILLSGISKLAAALPSYKPWEWEAQTVLPPLIVVLSVYYVLSSMYRTTSFFIRMAFRLLKWGTIFSVLGGAYTWLASGGAGNEVANALNQLFGSNARQRTGHPNTRSRARSSRPRPWDSFTAHQQWQYNEEEARRVEAASSASDVQRAVQYIAGLAGRAMTGSAGDLFKSFVDSTSDADANLQGEGSEGRTGPKKQTKRKAKAASQRRTSSR